jgi:hypothetical protein
MVALGALRSADVVILFETVYVSIFTILVCLFLPLEDSLGIAPVLSAVDYGGLGTACECVDFIIITITWALV